MTDAVSLVANAERAVELNKVANERALAVPADTLLTRSGAFETAFWVGYGYAMACAICLEDTDAEMADAEGILRPMLRALGDADED